MIVVKLNFNQFRFVSSAKEFWARSQSQVDVNPFPVVGRTAKKINLSKLQTHTHTYIKYRQSQESRCYKKTKQSHVKFETSY